MVSDIVTRRISNKTFVFLFLAVRVLKRAARLTFTVFPLPNRISKLHHPFLGFNYSSN